MLLRLGGPWRVRTPTPCTRLPRRRRTMPWRPYSYAHATRPAIERLTCTGQRTQSDPEADHGATGAPRLRLRTTSWRRKGEAQPHFWPKPERRYAHCSFPMPTYPHGAARSSTGPSTSPCAWGASQRLSRRCGAPPSHLARALAWRRRASWSSMPFLPRPMLSWTTRCERPGCGV